MTDNITLRRADAERFLWAAMDLRIPNDDSLAALRAALAEPEKGNCADGSCNCCWTDKPDAKREPATDATDNRRVWDAYIEACREFERFHGIRKEDK